MCSSDLRAILLSVVALGLGACSEDNPWSQQRGMGGIDLKLTASADVKDATPVVRADVPALVAPEAADFAISLRNLDTDEVKTWPTLDDFNAEQGFATGAYTLTAYYGSINECGFEKPYFTGEASVNVLEGRESSVEVTAQLANSMLSVEYTDAFRNYFPDYKVAVHSEGQSYVEFTKSETRPGFFTPGAVTLQTTLTNPSGKTVTLQAAEIQALARHHYHVTFDVNAAETGNATMTVSFDDSLQQEDVTIPLTDELFTSTPPSVTAVGFENGGAAIEALAGDAASEPLKFMVSAKGGLKSAKFTIAGPYTPIFGKEIELISATAEQQQQIANLGIVVKGLFKNPDAMASVDVTELSRYLTKGQYQVSLVVTDLLDRASEPVTLNLSTAEIELSPIEGSAVYAAPGTDAQATVKVSYNASNPQGTISFKSMDQYGVYKDCQVIDCKESTRTRAFETKTYIFTLKLPDTEQSPLPMQMFYNGQKWGENFTIDVVEPQFTVQADALAKSVRFKVEADAQYLSTVANALKVQKNGVSVADADIQRDVEKGILTVSGLNPGTEYMFSYGLTSTPVATRAFSNLTITTEEDAQIPNSDFSQTEQTINTGKINAGGQYKITIIGTFFNYSSITASEPTGWASINQKTCYDGSNPKNTWFMVPSTYAENGAVVIRNVAYDHNGQLPSVYNQGGAGLGKYWSKNAPASFANQEAGELFLGSYSFAAGQETRADGIAFASRPASVSFDYSYATVAEGPDDNAVVTASVIDAAGNVITTVSRNVGASSNMQTVEIPFGSYPFGVRAAKIFLSFKSSNAATAPVHVPSGDELRDISSSQASKEVTIAANQYKSKATGSVLTVDNVKLNY